MSTFEPGETAVLPNSIGARLFHVDRYDQEAGLVYEKQREGQPEWGVRFWQLVKVENAERAKHLDSLLQAAYERKRAAIRDAETTHDSEVASIIAQNSVHLV